MAGGTGGHIFPALAVAKQLQLQGWEIHWLGTKLGLERDIIAKFNRQSANSTPEPTPNPITLHTIFARGLRRKGLLTWAFAPFQLITALLQSIKILYQLKPKVVLSMGGFVSGPGGIAAWLMRYPLVVHEQNSVVGLTNRWLSLVAKQVLEAFPGAFNTASKAICVGNPVRQTVAELPPPAIRFQERIQSRKKEKTPLRLLIIGGSRGAEALNKICPVELKQLSPDKRPEIWHQTGGGHEHATKELYQKLQVSARVEPFIDDMVESYAWADLVLCRAGALTIAELTAVGVASILVPFPFAVDDHQTTNAYYLTQSNAALLIPQSQLSEKLSKTILDFVENEDMLLEMAENARRLAKPEALAQLTDYCIRTSLVNQKI